MKLIADFTNDTLIKDLTFFGMTERDSETVARIKEIEEFLWPVFYRLTELEYQVSKRSEASARDIFEASKACRKTLLWNLIHDGDRELVEEILNEVETLR